MIVNTTTNVLRRATLRHAVTVNARSFSSTPGFPPSDSKSTKNSSIVFKTDIAKELSQTYDLSMAKSERILNSVLDSIVEAVGENRKVRLSKFGSFESYESKGRSGRNPRNGQAIEIPAKKRIRFRAFDHFKDVTAGSTK